MRPGVLILSVGDPLGELHGQGGVLRGDGDADVLAFEDGLDAGVGRERADAGVLVDRLIVLLDGLEERGVGRTKGEIAVGVGLARVGLAGQGVLRDRTGGVELGELGDVVDRGLVVGEVEGGLVGVEQVDAHAVQLSDHVPLGRAVDAVVSLSVGADLGGVVEQLIHGLGRHVLVETSALEDLLVVGGDVGAEVPGQSRVVVVGAQGGGVPNGLHELVADTGGLDVVVHEEVGLGQGEDGGRGNVDDVRHLAVRGLSGHGLVELGAAALVGPVDLDAGVGILEFLDLGLEEVAEVVLQTLGLERDLAFDLRGVDLRVVEVARGNVARDVGLGNGTGSGRTAARAVGAGATRVAGSQAEGTEHGEGDDACSHLLLQHAKPPLVRFCWSIDGIESLTISC